MVSVEWTACRFQFTIFQSAVARRLPTSAAQAVNRQPACELAFVGGLFALMESRMKNTESAERMLLTGVYAIIHLTSGKRYVGSASISFFRRHSEHRRDLRARRHHSVLLQRAWDKYGADSFEFRILRVTTPEEAVSFEQAFIDLHKAADKKHGYNIAPIAGSLLGYKHSPESRAKMSAVGRGKKRSPETRAKMSAASMGKTMPRDGVEKSAAAKRGVRHSPEARAKMSAAGRGRKHSPEHNANVSAALRGRVVSRDAIAKIAATKLRNKLAKASAILVFI